MDQFFQLPLFYKGKQLNFKANLIRVGYGYQFQVKINEQNIFFEPDEEGMYRAINYNADFVDNKKIDIELLKMIAEALEILS
jgi:hypothetical protein